MIAWAVIPFGAPLPTPWGKIDLVVADLPIGFLFVLAITSLGVYGIVLAGWSSNNKYALLGGLRSSAQMVSYEIAMGMSGVPCCSWRGTSRCESSCSSRRARLEHRAALDRGLPVPREAFAETNRVPFDLPEAESELVAGYHTEYSAMKFSMFFIAEYANMITASRCS
jgi:NADH-quinone oxidoreductase subunit H